MISLYVDSAGIYKPTPNVVINPISKAQSTKENSTFSKANDKQSQSIKRQVDEYKRIEQLVRAHEQAHIAAGGGLVKGGATYSYQVGPDGKRYIVGGEVQIDASPVPDNPEATIAKMQKVRRAALAPSDPSPQDRAVAAQASKAEALARMELSKKQAESYLGSKDNQAKLVDVFA